MSEELEISFMNQIQENDGIIHKVIMLYADLESHRKDLKQEILLQAWKSYPNFRGDSKFSTWLYRISLNTALSCRKGETKKQVIRENYKDDLPNTEEENEHSEILYRLIKQLNEVDRMIMTLHMEGYKNPEIAEITGMNQNNINVRLHRIKGKIINQFKSLNHG